MFCHPIRPKLVLVSLFAHFGAFALVRTLLGMFRGFCRLIVEHAAQVRKLGALFEPKTIPNKYFSCRRFLSQPLLATSKWSVYKLDCFSYEKINQNKLCHQRLQNLVGCATCKTAQSVSPTLKSEGCHPHLFWGFPSVPSNIDGHFLRDRVTQTELDSHARISEATFSGWWWGGVANRQRFRHPTLLWKTQNIIFAALQKNLFAPLSAPSGQVTAQMPCQWQGAR